MGRVKLSYESKKSSEAYFGVLHCSSWFLLRLSTLTKGS